MQSKKDACDPLQVLEIQAKVDHQFAGDVCNSLQKWEGRRGIKL
jgi:hypothetical protein